jgi:tetratricopeptide (TPR) repeat protein
MWAACVIYFILALLSKSMAVSLPFVLLLIDYQQGRTLNSSIWKEKIPLFVLAIGFSIPPFLNQHNPGYNLDAAPMADGFLSLVHYLSTSILPINLSALYAREAMTLSAFDYITAIVVIGILILAIKWRRDYRRDFGFGLLFFLVTIFPILKFISFASDFIFADRYMYLPSLGLIYSFAIILSGELFKSTLIYKKIRIFCFCALVIVISLFSFTTFNNVKAWHNSESLWTDVLSKYPGTSAAHNNLGTYMAANGKLDIADGHFLEALRLRPDYPDAHANYGLSLVLQGKVKEGIEQYEAALQINPNFPEAHNNLGNALASYRKYDEAIGHFKEALRLKPDFVEAHYNLGMTFLAIGNKDLAISEYNILEELNPDVAQKMKNSGLK